MFPAEYSHIHTDQGIYSVLQDNGAPQYSYAKLDGFPGSNDDTRGQGQVHINPLGQGSCGVNVPLTTVECPSDSNLPNCLDVACGELCDGDDECETDNLLNNCGCGINGDPTNCWDVYRKTCATNAPTNAPTNAITNAPTKAPTKAPTSTPSKTPTKGPTKAPTTCNDPVTNASCARSRDCACKKKCKGLRNDRKCRERNEDCITGETPWNSNWGCLDGKECVADANAQWGKCV